MQQMQQPDSDKKTDVDDKCCAKPLKTLKLLQRIFVHPSLGNFRANKTCEKSNGHSWVYVFWGRFAFFWNNGTVEKSKQFTHTAWKLGSCAIYFHHGVVNQFYIFHKGNLLKSQRIEVSAFVEDLSVAVEAALLPHWAAQKSQFQRF